MKKFTVRFALCLSAALLVLSCGCEKAETHIPSPTENFYVNDFADVLEKSDYESILNAGVALESASAQASDHETGAQVVAVTVETTDGEEIADYALTLGREWGVGGKEDNNGVVILLATEDREIYVAVGYGLEGALPDSKTGRLIDTYAIDYFAENEFSKGMLNLYNAIVREVYAEYGLDAPESISAPKEYVFNPGEDGVKKVIISWAVLLIILLAYYFIFIRPSRRFISGWHSGFGGGFGGFGGFGGGSGGFGGFSGGSGGFGGFSGGGGSFGGGGAGRGF